MYTQFDKGQKVRTYTGQIRTVLFQRECQVFMVEESMGWYHPSKLIKVYPSNDRKGRQIWVTIPED